MRRTIGDETKGMNEGRRRRCDRPGAAPPRRSRCWSSQSRRSRRAPVPARGPPPRCAGLRRARWRPRRPPWPATRAARPRTRPPSRSSRPRPPAAAARRRAGSATDDAKRACRPARRCATARGVRRKHECRGGAQKLRRDQVVGASRNKPKPDAGARAARAPRSRVATRLSRRTPRRAGTRWRKPTREHDRPRVRPPSVLTARTPATTAAPRRAQPKAHPRARRPRRCVGTAAGAPGSPAHAHASRSPRERYGPDSPTLSPHSCSLSGRAPHRATFLPYPHGRLPGVHVPPPVGGTERVIVGGSPVRLDELGRRAAPADAFRNFARPGSARADPGLAQCENV